MGGWPSDLKPKARLPAGVEYFTPKNNKLFLINTEKRESIPDDLSRNYEKYSPLLPAETEL